MCHDYESHLASQVLRDREFDSAVRVDFNKAAETSAAPTKPFNAISKTLDSFAFAVASGDVRGAQEIAQQAVDDTLQSYYKGLGVFDHVRFLSDLETSKGAPLDQAELRLFGRIVGEWVTAKYFAEVAAIRDRNDHSEVRLKEVLGE